MQSVHVFSKYVWYGNANEPLFKGKKKWDHTKCTSFSNIYIYNYLFGKDKPVDEKHFIKIIHKGLKYTCEISQIPYNITSHSFRINIITRLLQNISVQDAADIIGQWNIKSTMAYKRYALNKTEIQSLFKWNAFSYAI